MNKAHPSLAGRMVIGANNIRNKKKVCVALTRVIILLKG